jgi:hypothetical protein
MMHYGKLQDFFFPSVHTYVPFLMMKAAHRQTPFVPLFLSVGHLGDEDSMRTIWFLSFLPMVG